MQTRRKMNGSRSESHRGTIQAAIFDMDGVIVDSHPIHRKAWKQFLHILGREVSESDLDYILEGRKRSEILSHFLGALSSEQIQEYGERKDFLFRESACEVRAIPGLRGIVRGFASCGIPMAVATSASESRTRFTLAQLRLQQHFCAVVTSKDVPRGKPAPDLYTKACERIGVRPSQAIAFEDSVAGVQSAKSAGLRCAGVLTNQSAAILRAAGADFTLPDFVGVTVEDLCDVTC
jgi:beta-phosphoglucomutase